MSGKGSAPRPYSVDQKTFGDNWDRIFKKEKQHGSKDRQQDKDSSKEDQSGRNETKA